MSDLGDHARDLHEQALSWPAAPRAVGPLADAMNAGNARLQTIQREEARRGTSLMAQDARDLAAVIERAANAARIEGKAATFELIIAYALAGRVVAARCEEFDISSGDAA